MILSPPTPELPVRSVRAAQAHYRDRFGFRPEWHHPSGRIGAISHGDCAIFLRETKGTLHPVSCWIFAADVDACFADLSRRGADLLGPPRDTEWGLRQFTARDLHGHILHFHHDLGV